MLQRKFPREVDVASRFFVRFQHSVEHRLTRQGSEIARLQHQLLECRFDAYRFKSIFVILFVTM